jgi:hypothetical protein
VRLPEIRRLRASSGRCGGGVVADGADLVDDAATLASDSTGKVPIVVIGDAARRVLAPHRAPFPQLEAVGIEGVAWMPTTSNPDTRLSPNVAHRPDGCCRRATLR